MPWRGGGTGGCHVPGASRPWEPRACAEGLGLPASSLRFMPSSTVPVVSLNTSGWLPALSVPNTHFSGHFPEKVGQWPQGSRGLSLSIPGPSSEDSWVSWPSQRLLCPPAPSAGGQQQVCPVPG